MKDSESTDRLNLQWRTFDRCPLCKAGKDLFQKWFESDFVHVAKCARCGFKFLNPYVSPQSMLEIYSSSESMSSVNKKLTHYYDHFEGSKTENCFRVSLEELERLGPTGSLLDIGCGRGKFLTLAREREWRVIGIEPGAEHAAYAKEKLGIEVVNASIEEAEFGEMQFNAISMWDVIEHVDDPMRVLKKINAWLKPSGFLLLATPNHKSLLNFLARAVYLLTGGIFKKPLTYFFVPEHVFYFTPTSLGELLRECGFIPVKEMATGTDIDRYAVSPIVKMVARALLPMAKILRAENRMVWLCQKV